MNKKERKQIYRFASAVAKVVKEINRFVEAARKATISMSKLPVLVKACKEKHGLTDR